MRGAVGIGRGEQRAHGCPFGNTQQHGPPRTGRVHHRPDIVHARFEREGVGDAVRTTQAALVLNKR